ncbi:hypothetical protein JCM17960_16930 [Magnetospira thiophila]
MNTFYDILILTQRLHLRYDAPPLEQRRAARVGGTARLAALRQAARASEQAHQALETVRAIARRRSVTDTPETDVRIQDLRQRLENLRRRQ